MFINSPILARRHQPLQTASHKDHVVNLVVLAFRPTIDSIVL